MSGAPARPKPRPIQAVPVVWQVVEHGSAQVAFSVYRPLLQRAAALLPERPGKAVFLHNVHLTGQRHGPVHLALARPGGDDEDPLADRQRRVVRSSDL